MVYVFGLVTCKSFVKWACAKVGIMEVGPSQNDLDSGPRKSCIAHFLRRTRKKTVPKERERHMTGSKVKEFDSMLVGRGGER